MLLALLVGILAYSAYTQKQIYQESTANLLSTYGQSAKTFTMFAQRNWNILNDWDSYLGTLAELGEQEGQWQEYIAQKATWQYTDFYLFNEQCEFWTTAGRQGTAEYMKATFEKLYFDRVLTVLEQHSQPFALFYMDLDRFKPVNDTYP